MNKEMIERIARALWNIRREDDDRCDMELEGIPRTHSVWKEAAIARIDAERGKEAVALLHSDGYWTIAKSASPDLRERLKTFGCRVPVFLSPTIPEGMALVPVEQQKNAARYDWLRNSSVGPSQIWELLSDDCNPPIMTLKSMGDLDSAIDAAMLAAAQGERNAD